MCVLGGGGGRKWNNTMIHCIIYLRTHEPSILPPVSGHTTRVRYANTKTIPHRYSLTPSIHVHANTLRANEHAITQHHQRPSTHTSAQMHQPLHCYCSDYDEEAVFVWSSFNTCDKIGTFFSFLSLLVSKSLNDTGSTFNNLSKKKTPES